MNAGDVAVRCAFKMLRKLQRVFGIVAAHESGFYCLIELFGERRREFRRTVFQPRCKTRVRGSGGMVSVSRTEIDPCAQHDTAERKCSDCLRNTFEFAVRFGAAHHGSPEITGEQKRKNIKRPGEKGQIKHPVNQQRKECKEKKFFFRPFKLPAAQKESRAFDGQKEPCKQGWNAQARRDVQQFVVRMNGSPRHVSVQKIFRCFVRGEGEFERFRADAERMTGNQRKGRFPDRRAYLIALERFQKCGSRRGEINGSGEQKCKREIKQNSAFCPRPVHQQSGVSSSEQSQRRRPGTA